MEKHQREQSRSSLGNDLKIPLSAREGTFNRRMTIYNLSKTNSNGGSLMDLPVLASHQNSAMRSRNEPVDPDRVRKYLKTRGPTPTKPDFKSINFKDHPRQLGNLGEYKTPRPMQFNNMMGDSCASPTQFQQYYQQSPKTNR